MRTKLFLSFLLIILIALLSNFVFERLIINDFNEYVSGSKEDRIYWVMASVEGSYRGGSWDETLLRDSMHWAIMLGFESYLTDMKGKEVISTTDVLSHLSPTMLRRMASLFELPTGYGEFTWYPLFVEGKEIGKIYFRPLKRRGYLPLKEEIFRKRGRQFLLISFAIAGGGALFLSIAFSFFLSRPLRQLTAIAEAVAEGDFSRRTNLKESRLIRIFGRKDEIERLSETFNYMVSALEKEDRLRKHLTTNIAHELRTPLTVVKGNLEAIEDGIITDINQALTGIKKEIDRIIELVQGIEDVTQAEASFFKKGKKQDINLKEFLKDIVSTYQHPVTEKGIQLSLKGPSMVVRTYPDKLQIIIKNLVSNAYRYTDRGSIEVSWGKTERGFYIKVQDTGRGMDEKELSRIFDRFYKGEGSPGRGIGLSIVKELVDVLDGVIDVQSSPGKGTAFRVEFGSS